jgi:hypothetical protein
MKKIWTEQEISLLKEYYSTAPISVLLSKINRTSQAIYYKAHMLGIKSYAVSEKSCSKESCIRSAKEPGAGNGMCRLHWQRAYKQLPGVKERYASCARKFNSTTKGQYNSIKFEAKRRGIEFFITLEEYIDLRKRFNDKCFYHGGDIVHNGGCLDRVDNATGYKVDNCVLCCGYCNRLKGDNLTLDETKVLISALKRLRNTEDIWSEVNKIGVSNRR